MRQYRLTVLIEAEDDDTMEALVTKMITPALGGSYYWHDCVETDEMTRPTPGWVEEVIDEATAGPPAGGS